MPEQSPIRVDPATAPRTEPLRRLEPEKICPQQRQRIGERVRRMLP